MICKECGVQLPDIAKFCYKCGKTISADDLQNDFDPFGTDDGFMPEKKVTNNEPSQEETKPEKPQEDVESVEDESVDSVQDEDKVQEEQEVLTENVKEDAQEKDEEESQKDEDEEETPANTGFKIMRNPDYVPPEVEEEKPFYEEHVNYEEIREQRAAKMEKRMQILSVFIGIAVLIGIGLFAFTKYSNHQDYTKKYDAAQALYDAGDYEGAFAAFGELVEHKGADEEEMVCKQFECLQAIGDEARARDFAYNACRKYSSDNIRKLLNAVNTGSTATKTPASAAPTLEPTQVPSQAPTLEPTQAPSQAPTLEPTQTPSQAPTLEPTQAPTTEPTLGPSQAPTTEPTQAPTVEPTIGPNEETDVPMGDYTAYEETFTQLYTGMEELKNYANPIEAIRVMITEEYAMLRSYKQNIYYVNGAFATEVATADNVLMVCDNGYVYFGSMTEGKPSGAGAYISASKDDLGISYYYFRGLWENGYPNGAGNIETIDAKTGIKSVTSGKYIAGAYDGDIVVTNYRGVTELDKTTYSIAAGVPTVLKDTTGKDIMVEGKAVIGYKVSSTGEQTAVTWDGTTKFVVEGLVY